MFKIDETYWHGPLIQAFNMFKFPHIDDVICRLPY
jgi:hypothetical protein